MTALQKQTTSALLYNLLHANCNYTKDNDMHVYLIQKPINDSE